MYVEKKHILVTIEPIVKFIHNKRKNALILLIEKLTYITSMTSSTFVLLR